MSYAERWLYAFGHALAAHSLYGEGHQARHESTVRLFGALDDLLRADLRPTFTFLDEAVIYRALPVHGLREWSWGRRLGAIGVRRIEFTRDATPEAMGDFLLALHRRLAGDPLLDSLPRWTGIEAGDVVVANEPRIPHPDSEASDGGIALGEEVEAMRFLCDRVALGEGLSLDIVAGVVRSLTVAIHGDGELVIPLLPFRSADDHLAQHAVNSGVLAMSFSEWLGLGANATRSVARAALLHDIGMARVPSEVFRNESLSEAGRSEVARHPETGARLLLAESPDLDLAATTAYEHHLRVDGTGYPARRTHRDLHYISRVVAVCGAYDALRSERCYRPARDSETALREIEAGAGSAYDPALAAAFVQMMRRWSDRQVTATV